MSTPRLLPVVVARAAERTRPVTTRARATMRAGRPAERASGGGRRDDARTFAEGERPALRGNPAGKICARTLSRLPAVAVSFAERHAIIDQGTGVGAVGESARASCAGTGVNKP